MLTADCFAKAQDFEKKPQSIILIKTTFEKLLPELVACII